MSDPVQTDAGALAAHWVVWSYEHDAWWASHSRGYVNSLLLAGVYSETEAKEIEEGATYGKVRREEARPLAAALEAEYTRWGRRGGMVIDALLAVSGPVDDDHGEAMRERDANRLYEEHEARAGRSVSRTEPTDA